MKSTENDTDIFGSPKGGKIPAKELVNTRDLGGLETAEGRKIIPGRLLRSGELYQLCPEDMKLLTDTYNLKLVIDLRTKTEQEHKPDTQLAGVRYISNPILDEDKVGISRDKSLSDMILGFEGDAEAYMQKCYCDFVMDDFAQREYGLFFEHLSEHQEGAVLWHCSAGKDRVGVATALLLTSLGVPKDIVMADYMCTNSFVGGEVAEMTEKLKAKGTKEKTIKNIQTMLSVRESYLENVFETICNHYQTVENYFYQALGVTPEQINNLQNQYLI